MAPLYLICAAAGCVVGSFLTVVASRVPAGRSIVNPGSSCDACGHQLTPVDMVPVASWIVLRGKCRHCGTHIGADAPLIEAATALVFVLFGTKFVAVSALVSFCVLGAALVVLSAIDFRERKLPRKIIYVAMLLSAATITFASLRTGEPERIWQSLAGAGIALAIMGSIFAAAEIAARFKITASGAMGDGDVRLAPLLGMHLGYLNPGLAAVGLYFGFTLGAVTSLVLMATGKADRKSSIPFGPFLAAGTIGAVFFGQATIDLIVHR